MERTLTASMVENAVNMALRLDVQAQEKLALLDNCYISITLDSVEKTWIFVIQRGYWRIVTDSSTLSRECDIRLRGNLAGFLGLFRKEQSLFANAKLYIEGDLHVAQQFQRVMQTLSPDFSAVLIQHFGTRLGGAMGTSMQWARKQVQQVRQQTQSRVSVLTQDARFPWVDEQTFAQFCADISSVQQRLALLESQLNVRNTEC